MSDKNDLLQEGPGEFRLSGLVNLDTVARFKEKGLAVLARGDGSVSFDFSEARVEGSAVIALLIALQREADRAGREVGFVNCPSALLDIAGACGVREVLGCR